jgi:protein-disulfide isomerase
LKSLSLVVAACALAAVSLHAQAPGAAPASSGQPSAPAAQPAQPADPFPPANPKYFTAKEPTPDTVNTFLKALWGYDANRIWRVMAIQTTPAAGVAKVVVFITDKGPNAKVQSTTFYVLPDGKHALAEGAGVVPFAADPFVDLRNLLRDRANGASRGAASKDLELVEFADLQCPHCKDAQTTMDQLAKDFPNAHIVFQLFPLTEIHPSAFKAAAYGYCVQKESNDAFFKYASAVFDTQDALSPTTDDSLLKAAVTRAGLDPNKIAACAVTPAAKDAVEADIKLGEDAGVDQTPLLAVNGRMLPVTSIPYEQLKKIVEYQAAMDHVPTRASAAPGATPAGE